MAPTTQMRALYRALLRELPPHPLLASPRAPLHAQLRAQFEASSSSSSSSSARTPPHLSPAHAQQYLAFLQAQREHTMLLERYNPGMAGLMDEQERVRLSARRVGMNLPTEFSEDGE